MCLNHLLYQLSYRGCTVIFNHGAKFVCLYAVFLRSNRKNDFFYPEFPLFLVEKHIFLLLRR